MKKTYMIVPLMLTSAIGFTALQAQSTDPVTQPDTTINDPRPADTNVEPVDVPAPPSDPVKKPDSRKRDPRPLDKPATPD